MLRGIVALLIGRIRFLAPLLVGRISCMAVSIGVRGGDVVSELASLAGWLRGERELAGRVRVVYEQAGEGELGGALDVVSVAVGSGGVGVALSQTLSAWLRTRRSDVKLTITAEGRTIEVDARRVADAADLITRVLGQGTDADA